MTFRAALSAFSASQGKISYPFRYQNELGLKLDCLSEDTCTMYLTLILTQLSRVQRQPCLPQDGILAISKKSPLHMHVFPGGCNKPRYGIIYLKIDGT